MTVRSVKIVVTDEAIYFANTGRTMDRAGVISIANQDLSAKTDTSLVDRYKCRDSELPAAITKRRLDLYRQDDNDVTAHFNQEKRTLQDYAGRALWELLQNADDAMAPAGSPSSELIGAKGLGFKSVLELTNRPEIHSGPFHFAFDPDRSKTMLSEFMSAPPPLVFRLPHPIVPDELTKSLRSSGFVTVMKLPHKGQETRRETERKLRALAPHFLLLCQHLTSVEIQFCNGSARRMNKEGGRQNGMAVRAVLSTSDDGVNHDEEWRIWSRVWKAPTDGSKRLSAAIAVKVKEKVAVPVKAIPLHVFFPTEETMAAPFLVHAAFDLTSDRNYLSPQPDASGRQAELIKMLGELAGHATSYLEPASAIELFRPLAKLLPSKKVTRKIERGIFAAVKATAFVPTHGGRLVKPADARTWSHDLVSVLDSGLKAIREARLCAATVIKSATAALHDFGAEPLSVTEYAALLGAVRCNTLEECLRAVNVVRLTCLEGGHLSDEAKVSLAKGAFWYIRTGQARSLEGKRSLVDFQPDVWPSWLDSDELHPDFKLILSSVKESEKWVALTEGRLLRNIDNIIAHCLAPALRRWSVNDWDEQGWSVLETINAWLPNLERDKIGPFIPEYSQMNEPARAALIDVARVPVGSTWVASVDAYASGEIGGSQEMADYFRKQEGRHVVGMPPKAKEIGASRWKALLKYLGVSWEPKIRELDDTDDPGLLCHSRYRSAVTEKNSLRHKKYDWYLDGFPDAVAHVVPARLLRMIEALQPAVSRLEAAYVKQWGSSRTYSPQPFRSCADYQLKREAYLPCRPSFAHSANRAVPADLYWEDRGLVGIAPTVDLANLSAVERSRLKKLLVIQLGVQEKLPDAWNPWLGWADGLSDYVARGGSIPERVVRKFYEEFVSRKFEAPPTRTPKRVVASVNQKLTAVPARDVVWIDKPTFDTTEVLDALSLTQPLFLPKLDRGIGAEQRLKVKKASEFVGVQPNFLEMSMESTAQLERRVKSRRPALAAMCERKGENWAEPGALRAVHGLSSTLTVADQVISHHKPVAIRSNDIWLINLDADCWEGLALACADRFRNSADLRLWFVRILRAESTEDVVAILREGGIPRYRLQDLSLVDDDVLLAPDLSQTNALLVEASPGDPNMAPGLGPELRRGAVGFKESLEEFGTGKDKGSKAGRSERAEELQVQPPNGRHLVSASSTILRKRPLDESGGGLRGSGNPGRAITAEAASRARELGGEGEDWFARRLEESIASGWTSKFNERDYKNRESDVVLSSGQDRWHIEIKTLSTERIYWSGLEYQKALENSTRYLMAFLVPDVAEAFRIFWSWYPLTDLLECNRRLDWVWAATDPGPLLSTGSWNPLPGLTPQRPPNRISYAIQVEQAFLDRLPCDTGNLELLWRHVLDSSTEEAAE